MEPSFIKIEFYERHWQNFLSCVKYQILSSWLRNLQLYIRLNNLKLFHLTQESLHKNNPGLFRNRLSLPEKFKSLSVSWNELRDEGVGAHPWSSMPRNLKGIVVSLLFDRTFILVDCCWYRLKSHYHLSKSLYMHVYEKYVPLIYCIIVISIMCILPTMQWHCPYSNLFKSKRQTFMQSLALQPSQYMLLSIWTAVIVERWAENVPK